MEWLFSIGNNSAAETTAIVAVVGRILFNERPNCTAQSETNFGVFGPIEIGAFRIDQTRLNARVNWRLATVSGQMGTSDWEFAIGSVSKRSVKVPSSRRCWTRHHQNGHQGATNKRWNRLHFFLFRVYLCCQYRSRINTPLLEINNLIQISRTLRAYLRAWIRDVNASFHTFRGVYI